MIRYWVIVWLLDFNLLGEIFNYIVYGNRFIEEFVIFYGVVFVF